MGRKLRACGPALWPALWMALVVAVAVGLGAGAGARARSDESTGLAIRWLGGTGFSIASSDTVLLTDPQLTRSGGRRAWPRQRADVDALRRFLAPGGPTPELARTFLVLVANPHDDHLADAAWIAERTGALLVGDASAVSEAEGRGLSVGQALETPPGSALGAGSLEVRIFAMGGANRAHLVTHRPTGLRVFVWSGTDLGPGALAALRAQGVGADLLLAALPHTGGREVARRLVESLRPRLVVPHRFDDPALAFDHADAAAPRDPEALEEFEEALRSAGAAADVRLEVRRLGHLERLDLLPRAAPEPAAAGGIPLAETAPH